MNVARIVVLTLAFTGAIRIAVVTWRERQARRRKAEWLMEIERLKRKNAEASASARADREGAELLDRLRPRETP